MSSVQTIEQEIRSLPREQARELRDWLADYLEDQETLAPEFIASIERGQRDLATAHVRVRQP